MNNIKSLSVKWSVSKAQDTYGYNICTVVNDDSGERFKCLGGGYDMLGTSLANFVESEYQAELIAKHDQAYTQWVYFKRLDDETNKQGYYGMTAHIEDNACYKVSLDGACGINSIERIIKEVLKLTLERKYSYDRKGRVKDVIGFYLYPKES